MIKTDLSSVDNQHENSHTYSYGIYANILREVCVLGAQQMLMYILYAAQGCSHSPTLISNTDNEETAAVTMETSEEDTKACVVVLLHGNSVNGVDSTWIWFPLNRTVQGHCFNRCVSVAALMTHTVISDSSLESKAPLLWWQYLHTCSNSQRLISTAFFGSAFSGGHTCTSRRIMAEHAAPGFFPLSGLMAGLKAEHQSTMLIQSRSATSAFLPWVQIFSRYCWWVWPRVEKSPTVHSQSGTDYLAWLDQDWCLQIGRNNSIRSHSILLTFKVAWVSLKFAFAKYISASIRELFLNDWYVKCFFQNVSKKKKKTASFCSIFYRQMFPTVFKPREILNSEGNGAFHSVVCSCHFHHVMDLNTSHDPTLPDSFCCVFNMCIRVNKTHRGHSPWCWPESVRPRQGCCEHRRCRLRRLMAACCWLLLRRSWSCRETAATAACSCIHLG